MALNILSWNINGLNEPLKRASFLDLLQRKQIDIGLIQESHLRAADISKCNNKFFRVAAYASANNSTKGVLILVRRSLQITILNQGSDEDGRITYITTTVGNRKIAFVSVYAPTPRDPGFFPFLLNFLNNLVDFELVVGADMNAVIDCHLDRSRSDLSHNQLASSLELKHCISTLSLLDCWRHFNSTARQYTFFSARHKSYSRIDFLFISSTLVSEISTTCIWPMSLSDHNSVFARLRIPTLHGRAARWRFNTNLLYDEDFCSQFRSKLSEFLHFNQGSVDDPRVLWGVLKGFIRDNSIAYASWRQKWRRQMISEFEMKLDALEKSNQYSFSDVRSKQIVVIKNELNILLRERAEFLIKRVRQNYYFNGSRPSHLLAQKLRSNEKFSSITTIKSHDGVFVTDQTQINNVFCSFFSKLYASEISSEALDFASFFQSLDLPHLSMEQTSLLDQDISLSELKKALYQMNKGKSPGLDGIPAEFYLFFWEELGTLMLEMFNYSLNEGEFHKDVNIALISLLLKKDKDPTFCSSYRPVSLINVDIKSFAKILASRLESLMPVIINCDQTGFIKTRSAADNIRRLLHIIHAADTSMTDWAILSLDAVKAFDRLEWPYLWSALEHFGFGARFISMIKILYANPSAMVLTGNKCSSPFSLGRGTRQGCPLSALLFTISLEPLAQAVRKLIPSSPITVKDSHHYISLYADDILLFLDRPILSIPALLDLFNDFGKISGYKINWDKSSLLPLNFDLEPSTLPTHIPVVKHFRYLGIDIYPCVNKIVLDNFSKILKQIKIDTLNWAHLPTSLHARIAVVKMNILPRLNFFSYMLPLPAPINYWDTLSKILSTYIWNGKRPRIKLSTLQRCKSDGGLAFPDFKKYAQAFTLKPLSTWLNPQAQSSWRSVEEALIAPYKLQDLIFSEIPTRHCRLYFGPVISHLILTWRTTVRQSNLHVKWHKHSPLFRNHNLLIGNAPFVCPQWESRGVSTLGDICDENGLRSFQDISEQFNLPRSTFFRYLQLKSALWPHRTSLNCVLKPHPMLEVIYPSSQSCSASNIYTFLIRASYKQLALAAIWAKDLDLEDPEFFENSAWEVISLSSKNPDHQIIHWKFLHRFYLTPKRRFHMHLSQSPICNLCSSGELGTFLHYFWFCNEVNKFWRRISMDLTALLNHNVPCSALVFLLNDFSSLTISVQQKRLLLCALTAAKKVLVNRWNPPHHVSRHQWILTALDIISMELSVARMHGAKQRTIIAWKDALQAMEALLVS
uniref:Reverse transcriptase domain-containing protein n=1 Tax=Astyanax mexicanus TaxID=7994 RepID=A0A3B1ICK8_ASTMX